MTTVPKEAIDAWVHYEPVEHTGPLAESNNIRHAFLSGWLAAQESRRSLLTPEQAAD